MPEPGYGRRKGRAGQESIALYDTKYLTDRAPSPRFAGVAAPSLRPQEPPAPDLSARAMDNLRYIRETMESAGRFTAVPGWGGVAMGLTALLAGALAARQPTSRAWLAVWLLEACVGGGIAAATMAHKARTGGTSLLSASTRKFALAFTPPVLVGAALTAALSIYDLHVLYAPTWLLCYGAAVVASGVQSVRVVPVMGSCFFVAGLLALAFPAWRDGWLALGFGVCHVGFGLVIARRHGG